MGGVNVKNTIVERVLDSIAPHLCLGCGKSGVLICDYCKYDIVSEPFCGCFACGTPYLNGLCQKHTFGLAGVYVTHERTGVIKALIDQLKFHHVKAAAQHVALLLHETIPLLPKGTIVVAVPTVRSHIRQRGYDHMQLVARYFADMRNLSYAPLIQRVNTATQHHLSRSERIAESRQAFVINEKSLASVPSATCIVLDDVITTGSTITNASKLLMNQGFTVFIGALAYQPLD